MSDDSKRQTHVSSLFAMVALLAGGTIGGLIGPLIAIPIAAALRVFIHTEPKEPGLR